MACCSVNPLSRHIQYFDHKMEVWCSNSSIFAGSIVCRTFNASIRAGPDGGIGVERCGLPMRCPLVAGASYYAPKWWTASEIICSRSACCIVCCWREISKLMRTIAKAAELWWSAIICVRWWYTSSISARSHSSSMFTFWCHSTRHSSGVRICNWFGIICGC